MKFFVVARLQQIFFDVCVAESLASAQCSNLLSPFPLEAMDVLLVLDVVAAFLYHHEQKALVPLLQTCTHFGPILTRVWDHVDNTLRVAAGCQGAWAVGSSQVTFFVRTGRQARRSVRRGTPQPLDLVFLTELGFFPEELLATLQIPQTFFYLSRSVRLFETHHGHLEVDEMEGLVEYTGYLHVFWVLQITTHFDSPLPADAEPMVESDSDTEWRVLEPNLRGEG